MNMNKNLIKEISLAVLAVVLAIASVVCVMSALMMISVYVIVAAVILIVALVLWPTESADEREQHHRALASDTAFTVVGILLLVIILVKVITHTFLDPWFIILLAAMVTTRSAATLWLSFHN